MADWKFWKKKSGSAASAESAGGESRKTRNSRVAMNTMLSSGSKAQTGDRYECCTGTLNNNQRLATLSMLRDLKNDD